MHAIIHRKTHVVVSLHDSYAEANAARDRLEGGSRQYMILNRSHTQYATLEQIELWAAGRDGQN